MKIDVVNSGFDDLLLIRVKGKIYLENVMPTINDHYSNPDFNNIIWDFRNGSNQTMSYCDFKTIANIAQRHNSRCPGRNIYFIVNNPREHSLLKIYVNIASAINNAVRYSISDAVELPEDLHNAMPLLS